MGSVVTAGSLDGVVVSILAQNAGDVSSIPAIGTIFAVFTGQDSAALAE